MREDERPEQSNSHSWNADDVWDDLMLQINDRDDDQGRDKGEEEKVA